MSRAFVREQDGDDAAALPDRPISTSRNFVTAAGLASIDAEVADLRTRLAAFAANDRKPVAAALSRDLRYWTARRATAELVERPMSSGDVRFGSTVTIERADGRRQTFRIVGEDEADPRTGTLSYVAPLAKALMGKEQDDEVAFRGESMVVVKVA